MEGDSTAQKAVNWLRQNYNGEWKYIADRDKFYIGGEWLTPEQLLDWARNR